MDDAIAPTQADRDAAADLVAWHNTAASEWHIEGGADLRFFAADMPDGIRKGIWDQHEFVQAFARHRIAHQPDSALADELRALVDRFRFDSDADVFRLIDKLTALGVHHDPS